MSRRGRATGAVAVLAAVALAAASCGVPTSSGVHRLGPGPEDARQSPGGGVAPPGPDEAATHSEQVDNFLQAAAGDPATAADRVREFLHSSEQQDWSPPESVRVVRLLDEPFPTYEADGGWRVELEVLPIGDLHPEGYLETLKVAKPETYEFRVVPEGTGEGDVRGPSVRLRIADPPPYVLLEDTALANSDYFYPNPIYFWDADRSVLVPDLRWLPLAGEPVEQHPYRVVKWLLGGPSPGLRAEGLPVGSDFITPPVWEKERLVVNLNAAVVETQAEAAIDALATQLTWSLPQLREGAELELRIDGQRRDADPAPRPWQEPVRLAVLDGVVRQLSVAGEPAPIPVLSGDVNTGVHHAALTSDGQLAALVREQPDGRQRLSVARARGGADPKETRTDLVASEVSQPVWVSAEDPTALVIADGALYQFTAAGDEVARVPMPGITSPITEVAVAPEGTRLAFIAGGELYVSSIRYEEESITVETPGAPVPTTVETLFAAAFSRDTHLVVAGQKDGRTGLYELTVDGGVEDQLHDLGNLSVSTLNAYPDEDPADRGTVMYEASGQAYTYAFTGAPRLIRADELVDAPDETESTPRTPFFLG